MQIPDISVRAPARSTAVNYVFSPSIRFNLLTPSYKGCNFLSLTPSPATMV